MAKPKAPAGCYWRGNTLWGEAQIKGRQCRWSLHTDNPKIARERREAGKAQMIAERLHGDAVHIFEDALEAWAAGNVREVGAKTHKRYLCSLAQLQDFLAGRKLTDINARLVGDLVEQRQRAGVTNATIKRDLGALSSVINYAIGRGWLVGFNPVTLAAKHVKERRDLIFEPRDDDIDLVLECCTVMWSELITAALTTGARQDELVSAKRRQLDLRRKELTLIGKGRHGVKKARVIDLEPFDGDDLFARLPAYVGSDFLFWHGKGEPFRNASSNFANNVMARAAVFAAKAGVGFMPFRFHDLRHKHAINWLRSGRSIYDLSRRLGHANVATTENSYLRFLSEGREQHERTAATKRFAGS